MGFCDLPLLIGGDNSSAVRDAQQIQATRTAFAAILGDGSVVAWSACNFGGADKDSSAVQDQLRNAQQIQAANGAFAAILGDKSVMTRGDAHLGGDSGAVQDRLKNVEQIQASESAFAANGCVVTWGCCSAWR